MPDRTHPAPLRIRIQASELPGRDCGFRNVHVAVQPRDRRGELLDPYPGDTPAITWTLDCTATPTPTGVDIRGPHVQGRPGSRFIYLTWGAVEDDGTFTMFRRAKLMLDAVEPGTLRNAVRCGHLTARLKLTDAKGQPLCAAVRPPLIDWSAAPDD